jgi:hypothetical protein
MNHSTNRAKHDWQAISSVITAFGIILSLFTSLYFGMILPKRNQQARTNNVINSVIGEINYNMSVLNISEETARLAQLTEKFESGTLPNENEILLTNNALFLYKNDYWVANKSYLAEYAPDYYTLFYHHYAIYDAFYEVMKKFETHEFAVYSYFANQNEEYKTEALYVYNYASILSSKIKNSIDYHTNEILKLQDKVLKRDIKNMQ